MKQYEITHHSEETVCENCFCKISIGDTVYQSKDELHAYCSNFCARAGERANAPLIKTQLKDDIRVDGWQV